MRKLIAGQHEETSLYDDDFYAWTAEVAEGLCQGDLSETDLKHVADEIADLGKRDRRELRSRMIVLIMHLMKWAVQPNLRKTSTWKSTIAAQRDQIEDLLSDSPSLRVHLIQELPALYIKASMRAADETGTSLTEFQISSAFRGSVTHIDRLLSERWYPDKMEDFLS